MKLQQNTNLHINAAYMHVRTQSPQNSVAIKRMCKQCVPGTLTSPSSVPGNEATLMFTRHHAYDSIFLPGLPPPFLPNWRWERPGNEANTSSEHFTIHSTTGSFQGMTWGYGNESCYSHHGSEQDTQISSGLPWNKRRER